MAKFLVIVESPAKAKTIQKYLGKDYDVMASKGHIKDLPKRDGVDTENNFEEVYEVITDKGKGDLVKSIKDKSKKVEEVLLAMDPDREGEAIAYHIKDEVESTKTEAVIRRVLFNEITKKGVAEGIANPRELDLDVYEAQRTRRVLDRIGGYPLSNLLWRKLAFGLSAGRVQTPALRIIVDRQTEIDAFVARDYWVVDTGLVGEAGTPFSAILQVAGGEKLERVSSKPAATTEIDAARFVADLKKAEYKVSKVTKRKQRRAAPAPYTTSKLQQDASNRISMQPKRAMRVAQTLYEGVAFGRGKNAEIQGLITYMRTDSVRLSDDAVAECRTYIEEKFGKDSVPEAPNVFKTKKQNVQDAHEAIRPTRMDLPPDEVAKYLKDDQLKLYKMIWDRFVACQMVPAVYDQTGVEITATADGREYGLRAGGSVLRSAGWRQVYGIGVAPQAGEESEAVVEEGSLPPIGDTEVLKISDPPGVTSTHMQTQPPPYFNEASLVKKLEEEGIGRPSTYAEIISKVQARDYVKKVENKLKPSDLGKLVIEKLVEDNFDLADIAFTRNLEQSLDGVAENKVKRVDVLRPFHIRLQEQIAKALETKGKWWPEPELLGEECPECKRELTKRWGRNGAFIGCPGYPDCKYSRNIPTEDEPDSDREPELTDYDCPDCKEKMMKRWGRNGFFLGCSAYPKCKHTRNLPLGIDCPKCGGEVVEIRAKGRGRPFYGCSNYNTEAKCDFKLWQKPISRPCPKCKAKFLVRAGKKDEPILKCVSEGCDHVEDLPEEGEITEVAPTDTASTGS